MPAASRPALMIEPDESPFRGWSPPGSDETQRASPTDSAMGKLFAAALTPPTGEGSRPAWEPPTVEQLQAGFAHYEIVSLLGRGAMGAVFKAWQRSLERSVAIKILPPDFAAGTPDFAERFQREAWALARCRHPSIVAAYDAGQTDEGLRYFVMEYIDGTDLGCLLAAEGKLPAPRALEIAGQVAAALDCAHRLGVIHRDIKPSNVMIERDGTVKVADFGLARFATPQDAARTRTDLRMGTPDYMPPEAFAPGVEVDHRADLYALGAMLYQMLTGQLPRGRFPLPSRVIPGLDPALDRIVDRALQPQPMSRFADALEMKRALDAAAARVAGGGRWPAWWKIGLAAAVLSALGFGSHRVFRAPPVGKTATPPSTASAAGRWMPIDLKEALRELDAADVGSGWWRLPGAKTFQPSSSVGLNRGLRATFRSQPPGTRVPELLLRDTGHANYNAFLQADGAAIAIQHYDVDATPRYQPLGTRALPAAIAPGTPYTLEFIAVGNRLRLRLGETVLEVALPGAPRRGRATLYLVDVAAFREVEVLDLDSLPEVEAWARVAAPVASAPRPVVPPAVP